MSVGLTVPAAPPRSYPLPYKVPRYSFVAGTWGDVIAGLGNHQHLMRELGQDGGAVIYYGPDPAIAAWLTAQPYVTYVMDLRSPGPVSGIPTNPSVRHVWLSELNRRFDPGLDPDEVWPCHVDFTLRERLPVHRPELSTAPELAEWADSGSSEAELPTVLLQPRSETSCLWEGHWPHWYEAVNLISTDATCFLCGKGDFDRSLFPRASLADMVNKTPTMPHLFALADACDAVVTTSNALSLYAAAKGLRTVVCCNVTHRRPEQFFTRFARGPRSRIVEHWEGMDVFEQAWAEVRSL